MQMSEKCGLTYSVLIPILVSLFYPHILSHWRESKVKLSSPVPCDVGALAKTRSVAHDNDAGDVGGRENGAATVTVALLLLF